METKICRKCNIEKETCEFGKRKTSKDGLRSYCNQCRSLESKQYRLKNPEKRKNTIKNYYEKNKDIINEKSKQYRLKNLEKLKEISLKSYHKNKNNEKNIRYRKKYRKLNRKKRAEYEKELKNKNINYKISSNVRRRINHIIQNKNVTKNNPTFDILGCSPEFLKEHLEKQFKDGMSWDNYGLYSWHIDHIIPLSSAETEDEIYKLCHYTNLQPLWAEENLSKGSKII
jgi:hypothetical protein